MNNKDIIEVMEFIHKNKPFHDLDEVHMHERGLGATIVFLAKADGEVKSVDISSFLNISSARMAVILKKLEQKDVIMKATSQTDSRAITISLTAKGHTMAKNLEDNMYQVVSKIVEEIGLEEFYDTFKKIKSIKQIFEENKPMTMEELHD